MKNVNAFVGTGIAMYLAVSGCGWNSDDENKQNSYACTQSRDFPDEQRVLDCSTVPDEVLKTAQKNGEYFPVKNLGECTLLLAFTEPSEASPIQTVMAVDCRTPLKA